MPNRVPARAMAPILAIFLLAGCIFALTYYHDNKYLAPPPYGDNGFITLTDESLEHPLSLVDGWLLSVEGGPSVETFIGQYSNFSFVPGSASAFGSATYELTIQYEGSRSERALVLLIPEIFTDYTLYVDGREVATQTSGSEVGLIVKKNTHLMFKVQNQSHYYSGITYPPVIGTARVVGNVGFVNALATCVLMLVPLVAGAFAVAVRTRGGGDELVRDFGIFCASFAVAGAHGLVWRLGLANTWWYALEDAAWLLVLVSGVALCMRVTGLTRRVLLYQEEEGVTYAVKPPRNRVVYRIAQNSIRVLWVMPFVIFLWVCFIIPLLPGSIEAYGWFQTITRLVCWVLFVTCAIVGVREQLPDARYVLYGCAVLGAALGSNLLDNNAYEPLYGLWQQEYAGLLLVGIFGWMLVGRVRRLHAVQEKVRDLQVQVRSAEESLLHLRRGEEEVRVARHDLHHHIATLRQFASQKSWDACRAYLDELAGTQKLQAPLRYAENTVVNAVLTSYLAPAQERGIQVTCDVRVPASLPMRDTELVVLVSNLLSNAVEGCETARGDVAANSQSEQAGQDSAYSAKRVPQETDLSISLFMRLKDQRLIMRCTNTAAQQAAFGKTTKADAKHHGYGLSVMKQITHQYHGEFLAEVQEGIAIVRIVLPLKTNSRTTLNEK